MHPSVTDPSEGQGGRTIMKARGIRGSCGSTQTLGGRIRGSPGTTPHRRGETNKREESTHPQWRSSRHYRHTRGHFSGWGKFGSTQTLWSSQVGESSAKTEEGEISKFHPVD